MRPTFYMPTHELVSPTYLSSLATPCVDTHQQTGAAGTMQDDNRQASEGCWLTAAMQGLSSRGARLGDDVVVLRLVPQELLRRHAVQLQRHVGARREGRAARGRRPCAVAPGISAMHALAQQAARLAAAGKSC